MPCAEMVYQRPSACAGVPGMVPVRAVLLPGFAWSLAQHVMRRVESGFFGLQIRKYVIVAQLTSTVPSVFTFLFL